MKTFLEKINRRNFLKLLGITGATAASTTGVVKASESLSSLGASDAERIEIDTLDEWLSDVVKSVKGNKSGCYRIYTTSPSTKDIGRGSKLVLEVHKPPIDIGKTKKAESISETFRVFEIEINKFPQSEKFFGHITRKYGRNLFLAWLAYGKIKKPRDFDKFIKKCEKTGYNNKQYPSLNEESLIVSRRGAVKSTPLKIDLPDDIEQIRELWETNEWELKSPMDSVSIEASDILHDDLAEFVAVFKNSLTVETPMGRLVDPKKLRTGFWVDDLHGERQFHWIRMSLFYPVWKPQSRSLWDGLTKRIISDNEQTKKL